MSAQQGMRGGGALRPAVYARRRSVTMPDWTDHWVCVGFAEQLDQAGAVLPATVGHHALHVLREADGTLTAAHNARPFGGCLTIPVQCAGPRKIRCPQLACAFSEDPDVLDGRSDPSGAARRQFEGTDRSRLVPAALARWGSLLFVNVTLGVPEPFAAFAQAIDGEAPGGPGIADLRAAWVTRHNVALRWRTGGGVLVAALLARLGAAPSDAGLPLPPRGGSVTVAATLPDAVAGAHSAKLGCQLVWPHLVLARLGESVLAAVLRPVSADSCSLLGAVLQREDDASDEARQAIAIWSEVLAAAALA